MTVVPGSIVWEGFPTLVFTRMENSNAQVLDSTTIPTVLNALTKLRLLVKRTEDFSILLVPLKFRIVSRGEQLKIRQAITSFRKSNVTRYVKWSLYLPAKTIHQLLQSYSLSLSISLSLIHFQWSRSWILSLGRRRCEQRI